MLRDRDRGVMLPPYVYKEQKQAPAEWLDAMAQLVSQYDGKDRWYLEAIGIAARGREDALYARLKNDASARSSATFSRLVWELRPKTALGDLIAVLNSPSASSEQRTNALDTLGAMEWPEAARALEAFITSPSSAPPLVEHAFGLYSHQLFSWWMDARTSPALPQIVRKMFAAPGAQVAAVAMVDVLGDAQYVSRPSKPSRASGSLTSRTGTRPSSLATRRTRFAPRRCAGWPAR
jgi:hypothetical protein